MSAIVTETETRQLVIRATNPQAAATTVRLELRPEPPDGPGSPFTVSARSLKLGAQATGEFLVTLRRATDAGRLTTAHLVRTAAAARAARRRPRRGARHATGQTDVTE